MAKKRGISKQLIQRDADLLVKIAIAFTVISSLLTLIFINKVILTAAQVGGIKTTPGNWIMLVVAWLFLVLFARIANSMSLKGNNKKPMWGLLIIGILLFLTGRVESGLLVGIAAVLYLYRSNKK